MILKNGKRICYAIPKNEQVSNCSGYVISTPVPKATPSC